MPDFFDRICEASVSVGTGNFILTGNFQNTRKFSDVYGIGNDVFYSIEADDGSWENGRGVLITATLLGRDTVYSSSNNGELVSFGTGSKKVFVDVTARVLNGIKNGYVHNQGAASASWNITHNLGKYPSVSVVDSANTKVYGGVVYNSVNQVTLVFSSAFSGKAFLN
jgi:hypothetical protein